MGITLFASGKIDNSEAIPRLIEDVEIIARERTWGYHVIDDDFDRRPDAVAARSDSDSPGAVIKGTLGLKGIILNIGPGAEPFEILFDRDGILTGMMPQVLWIEGHRDCKRFTMCKTQFAHIDRHIAIIGVLDMLKERYIPDLAVNDEGGYWKNRDRRELAGKRVLLDQYIRHAAKVISSIEVSEEERRDPNRIADRVEDALLNNDDERQLGQ